MFYLSLYSFKKCIKVEDVALPVDLVNTIPSWHALTYSFPWHSVGALSVRQRTRALLRWSSEWLGGWGGHNVNRSRLLGFKAS